MNLAEIVNDAAIRAKYHLADLETAGLPGSVVIQFHRDSKRIRKVVVTTEESWTLPENAEIAKS